MKTTVKTHTDNLIVKPSPVSSLVELHIESSAPSGGHRASVVLTQDQIGALIVGLEQAAAKAAA